MATITPVQLGMATPLGELLGRSDADLNAEFADYARLGVDWVRTDVWWNWIQPTAGGPYYWNDLDRVVAAANANGIKLVAELQGIPSWVKSSGGMASSANIQAYGAFAKAAAEHFKGKIQHWEIWNEPNLQGYWGATPNAADYTKALKVAYTAIKGVDPSSTIITGGLSPAPETAAGHIGAVEFLQQIYANGGRGYFDAVGYHPYSWPLMPSDPAAWNGWEMMEKGIRNTMVANGDAAVQVWMTEMGAPTAGGTNAVTQDMQAQIIQQSFDLARATTWAGPIMWYSYQDRGGTTSDTENWFGLVGPNGEHKAAYDTYQRIALHDGPVTAPTPPPPSDQPTFSGSSWTGTQNNDTAIGNDLDNVMFGQGGNDILKGGKGNDRIAGNSGNDSIWGGEGNDTLVFSTISDTIGDLVMDFAKGDRIDLSGIDANSKVNGDQAFTFIGSKWLSAAGHLGFYQDLSQGVTKVQGDLNGDGKFDVQVVVKGLHTFAASDFVL